MTEVSKSLVYKANEKMVFYTIWNQCGQYDIQFPSEDLVA